MQKMQIILGSKSISRQQILKEMGYQFSVLDPNIDEKKIRFSDPLKLTLALALAKAKALLPKIKNPALLITADQVVRCDGKIIEKPESASEAKEFLQAYAKHPAETITAIVVTNTKNKHHAYGIDIAKIWFKPIPKNIMEQIIILDDIYARAGGFSIENPLIMPYIAKIEGSRDSIMGLPKRLTEELVQKCLQLATRIKTPRWHSWIAQSPPKG